MSTKRLTLLSISITLFFSIIVGRFFYWQIIQAPSLAKKSLSQLYNIKRLTPRRGRIFTNDSFPLAQSQTVYNLSLYKPDLKLTVDEVNDQIIKINPQLSVDSQKNIDKFRKDSNIKWITLQDTFNYDQMLALKSISGIVFQNVTQRYYPEGKLAKNILGIIAHTQSGQLTGYEGLEGYYNKQLQGKTGYLWQAQDAQGNVLLNKDNWVVPQVDGRDLLTSINRSVQFLAEKTIKDGVYKYQANSGSISIIQPQTGDIMAIAYFENPEYVTTQSLPNPPITRLFEPGSIFKPLVVAMGLDSQSIDKNFVCGLCNRPLTIGEYTITNWNSELHADSTLYDIIKNSDNIGMSHIIRRIGLNKFLSYYQALGLNNKTGIDLQGEARPQVKSYWPEIDLATASFGQGIALTQIQMLQAFNTIANDGLLISPHLVQFQKEDQKVIPYKSPKTSRVFSSQTTDQVKDILKYSVENGVVATMKPKNLEVCAKSGTAQIALNGKYAEDQTIASYIGFSPCKSPKFTMIVTIDNPRSSPWGAQTAAPIWFDTANQIDRLLTK